MSQIKEEKYWKKWVKRWGVGIKMIREGRRKSRNEIEEEEMKKWQRRKRNMKGKNQKNGEEEKGRKKLEMEIKENGKRIKIVQ